MKPSTQKGQPVEGVEVPQLPVASHDLKYDLYNLD